MPTDEKLLDEICDYVKSDEFKESWYLCPPEVKFGDFFAELIRKKFGTRDKK